MLATKNPMLATKKKRKERVQTWVRKTFAHLFGPTKSLVTFIPYGSPDAVKIAKKAASLAHEAELATVASLPIDIQQQVIEAGGWLRYKDRARYLRDFATVDPMPVPALIAGAINAEDDFERRLWGGLASMQVRHAAELARVPPVALEVSPAADYTFVGLFNRWAGDRVAASSARNYKRTADRLTKCFGNVDVRDLRAPDARKFMRWLQEHVRGTASRRSDLGAASTLFATLDIDELPHGNPFAGAKKLRKEIGHVGKTKGAFSPAQLRALLDVAARERFGETRQRKDHEAVLWILKSLIYTGARIGETSRLTSADVRDDEKAADGKKIAYLHFRQGNVKARKDEDKSRKVPLHSDIAAGFEAFVKGRTGPVFGDGELYNWIESDFPKFLRAHAAEIGLELVDGVDPKTGKPVKKAVDADGQELTLHRIRASFQIAAELAGVSEKEIDDIVGHDGKTVRDKHYRKRLPVPVLKTAIDKVKPLG